MGVRWNKTILLPVMEWDYGIRSRGESLEKLCFFETLKKLVNRVEPFWIDGYLKDREKLRRALLERADQVKPDLIFFIPYKNEFQIEMLDLLKEHYTTFAWFGDDQWRFDSFSAHYAPHFTRVSTTDVWGMDRYRKLGIEPILTQWAAQPVPVPGHTAGQGSYDHDVSFVGGNNPFRTWFIKQLNRNGVQVDCFGAGWPKGRVTHEEMNRIFLRSRVNLNMSNSVSYDIRFVTGGLWNLSTFLRSSKCSDQVKARNFEIPLAGGFQLSHYVTGLEQYLDIGREVAVFTGIDDCLTLIQYYLQNEDKRREITARSRERAEKEHTYYHRLENILDHIWD